MGNVTSVLILLKAPTPRELVKNIGLQYRVTRVSATSLPYDPEEIMELI
jgi:hypothetical protein